MCIAVDKLMASPSRHESVGEGISVAYQTLLADLKQRFPEFSEDSVKSLINQVRKILHLYFTVVPESNYILIG